MNADPISSNKPENGHLLPNPWVVGGLLNALLACASVNALMQQIGMTDVAGVLIDHLEPHLALSPSETGEALVAAALLKGTGA